MKLLKASKILHIVVLLCCFLPAIMPSCGGSSKEDLERREKAVQDSINEVTKADSLKINSGDSVLVENKTDTSAIVNYSDTIKTDSTVVEIAKDTSTVKNSEAEANTLQKILKFLLLPDGENYSIAGFAVMCLAMSSPVIFMLMLVWASLLRFTNNNHKLIFIQTLIGFIALTIYIASDDYLTHVMWGFWVVYFLSLFNAILNWRIYFETKRNKQINVWGDL
jgi:hypothetical protein